MLRSLGVRPDRIPADPGARSALFRSTVADRRLLIVLDNARDTAQVRPLLPGAGPMVVVTSRTRLAGLAAREEARGIAVGRLSRHESVELLTAALRQDEAGVRDPLLGELATLCDGLPLALVIAADQIAGGRADLRQLIGDLRDRQARLDVLDSGDDPLSSLRATLTSSYDVLDPAAARLFRLLGEHPGADFEIGAAMALGGSGMTVPVTRLTDAHLVDQHRPGRFRLHDLVKQFAADVDADSAAAAEREPALDRLLAWYLHSAVAATRALGHGPPSTGVGAVPPGVSALTFDDTTSARAWFADERANLAAAVRHAAERGRHRASYGITQALSVYLSYEGSIDEARELQQIAIRSAQAEGDDRAIADLLRQLGSIYIRSGRHPDAIGTLRKSAAHWSRAGDDRGLAATHATLGMAYQATGRHAEALPLLYEGLDHARRTGAIDEQVRTLNNLAMSHIGLERLDVAMETVQEAFALLPDADGRWVEPYLWDTLGQAHAGLKEYGEAIAAYRKALELTRRVGERWGEPPVLHHLGLAQRAAGATADARASWEAALRLMAEAGTGQPYRPELLRLIATLGS